MKLFQRSKSDKLLKGNSNTKYFQLVPNGKYQKTSIFKLEEGDQIIKGEEELQTYITEYYKGLFGPSNCEHIVVDENLRNDIPQISDEDNEKLIEPFTEKELKEAILEIKHNKAPGLDGLSAEFYQFFLDVIKDDLMALFKEFHNVILPLFKLNYGIITLLQKKNDVTSIKQFRPICLLNVCFNSQKRQ
jgi:hypothetical protein